MKKFLITFLVALPFFGFTQIAINTTGNAPDASAALDVDWSGKGLLIPRLSLASNTDGTTISSPATSLLVYNTNASMTGGQGVGYYYNAGTPASPNWVKFLVGKEAWMITGNDNTDPATNFLGTTNDKDLQFRTNNLNRMRIMSSSYSTYPTVGIGTTVPVINLNGNSAVLHVHDGGNGVGSQLVLSTHSTSAGARSGGLFFAATQATNNRITANIQSYLTAYSGGNASGDLRFFTNNNNSVAERMRIYETGQLVLSDNATFPAPTANYLFTINPTTNNFRSGISIPMSGASSTAYAINVSTANANSRGYFYENTSGSNGVFYGAGSQLSTTNIASGYLSYRNSSGLTYGLYGINGTNAAYTTNANVWAAFIQGRAVISSESSPTSPLGVDLEIRNTTTGSGNPATLSMRQTTTETTSGRTLARLNFGDNHTTDPQAQISILRDAAGGSGDYPTAILFSTTLDGSNTLTERMRIVNDGNVGIGTSSPTHKLTIQSSTISTLRLIGPGSFGSTARLNFGDGNYVYIEEDADDYLTIYGSNRTAIMGGHVGVGVTNPAYNLEINGTFGYGNGTAGSYRSRTETRDNAGLQASQSGFFETSSPTNYPAGASSWWHLIDCRHSNNGNNYALQLAGSFFDQKLYFRKTNNNAAQPWTEVLSSANNPVSVSLASDITISSAAWTSIGTMTVTFTATKSTAFVIFSCSGFAYTNSMAYVQFRIWNSTTGVSIGGTNTHMQSYDDVSGTITPWSCSFSKNISGLTPGSSYTLIVQAQRNGIYGTYDAVINAASVPDSHHMTLTVFP